MDSPSETESSPAAGSRLPRVVIVGRPNVGKSTLLNRLAGSRVSIVEPTAGVTRDRIAVPLTLRGEEWERAVEVIDTGGIGIVDRDDLGPHVEGQVRVALGGADLVLFMVDTRDGVTPLDREVADLLRGAEIPILLLANKAEGDSNQWEVDSFARLGVGEGPFAISAQNGNGMADLTERMLQLLPRVQGTEERPRPVLKLAVVGRRNAGKSTLINELAGGERMIVSEVPGTTRDAVDVIFDRAGETFVVIDTAGVRKKKSHEDAIEFFSDARSHKAIRRADVVVLLFDATDDLSGIEKRLARYVHDHHKPLVLAANKWDLIGDRMDMDQMREYVDETMVGVKHAPLARLSARNGRGVPELFELAREVYAESADRVGTGELNRVLQRAIEARSPSSKGHRVRIYYATQADRTPPTFVLFVNDKRLIGKNYLRYLENCLRKDLPFKRVPLHLVLRDGPDPRESH